MSAERFLDAPVPILTPSARTAFEEMAEPLRERSHAAHNEGRHLAVTRDALLPGLMSGKLRVRDVELAVERAL